MGTNPKYLVACDPGLTDLGLAVYKAWKRNFSVDYELIEVVHFGSSPSKGLTVAQDNLRRFQQLGDFFQANLKCASPLLAVAVEEPTNLRNSAANAKLVGSWAILVEQCRDLDVPLLCLPPKLVRSHLGIPPKSEKKDTQDAMLRIFPSFKGWPEDARSTPHCFDAAAIGYAALNIFQDVIAARFS